MNIYGVFLIFFEKFFQISEKPVKWGYSSQIFI